MLDVTCKLMIFMMVMKVSYAVAWSEGEKQISPLRCEMTKKADYIG